MRYSMPLVCCSDKTPHSTAPSIRSKKIILFLFYMADHSSTTAGSVERRNIRDTLYDYFSTDASFVAVGRMWNSASHRVQRAWKRKTNNPSESHPTCANNIHISESSPDHPTVLTKKIETFIVYDALKFSDHSTLLTRTNMLSLAKHTADNTGKKSQNSTPFSDAGPTPSWLWGFLSRHLVLKCKPIKTIEDKRVQALGMENSCEYLTRMQEAMKHIHGSRRIVNVDETGISFKSICSHSLPRGIGGAMKSLYCAEASTKERLERVNVMGVVNAAGIAYRSAIMLPGLQAHYRFVNGQSKTIHTFPPICYRYQRENPGLDSAIFLDWARNFLRDTKELRDNGKYIMLVYDGCRCHVQLEALSLFKHSHVVVIGLPAHTSHLLQPLDVSIYGSFKSKLQKEFHTIGRRNRVVNCYDVGCIFSMS